MKKLVACVWRQLEHLLAWSRHPPAAASASVHMMEVVTTGISGLSHFSEFFVTYAESVTFVLTLSFLGRWQIIPGLLIGDTIAPRGGDCGAQITGQGVDVHGRSVDRRVEHPHARAGVLKNKPRTTICLEPNDSVFFELRIPYSRAILFSMCDLRDRCESEERS